MIDRAGLGDFLRRRRELLRPADVGLVAGARRRTPGLRREKLDLLRVIGTQTMVELRSASSPEDLHPSA